ncbi:sulfatase-like hydrolase/transferase [Cupriavidus basilensis]
MATTAPSGKKPNILVIFGDDVGQTNISAYSHGVVGYRTPNIDRIASEGMMLTDYYGENSCTAGRSTFITGEVGLRTGLLKVGVPGAPVGLQAQNVTIAQALKPAWLCDRPVRQEPPGRPQRVPADRARL